MAEYGSLGVWEWGSVVMDLTWRKAIAMDVGAAVAVAEAVAADVDADVDVALAMSVDISKTLLRGLGNSAQGLSGALA